ncbi:hypothetical protein ACQEU3_42115 [Spirillospora sp. CA-253888]
MDSDDVEHFLGTTDAAEPIPSWSHWGRPGRGSQGLPHPGRHTRGIQLPTGPHGEPIRTSPLLPGPPHDLTAARDHAINTGPTTCHADKGYLGTGAATGTPCEHNKPFNRHHANIRVLNEPGATTVKQCHIQRKTRRSTNHLTAIVATIPTLHHQAS